MKKVLPLLFICMPLVTSCQSGSVSGPDDVMDAQNSKQDDDFQQQIDKWVSDGKNLSGPQSVTGGTEYPILLAAGACLEKSMKFLLTHGVDAKVISNSASPGLSALDLVCGCSDDRGARMAELLLQNGAEVNRKNQIGDTPLFEARDHLKIAQVLIEHGADVNAQDANGRTPLQKAAFSGKRAIAELLINHGADINARDPNGYTALALSQMSKTTTNAQSDGHDIEGTIKLLQDHGAQ